MASHNNNTTTCKTTIPGGGCNVFFIGSILVPLVEPTMAQSGYDVFYVGSIPVPLIASPAMESVPAGAQGIHECLVLDNKKEEGVQKPSFCIAGDELKCDSTTLPAKSHKRPRRRSHSKKSTSKLAVVASSLPPLQHVLKKNKRQIMEIYQNELVAVPGLPVYNCFAPLRMVKLNSARAHLRTVGELSLSPRTKPDSIVPSLTSPHVCQLKQESFKSSKTSQRNAGGKAKHNQQLFSSQNMGLDQSASPRKTLGAGSLSSEVSSFNFLVEGEGLPVIVISPRLKKKTEANSPTTIQTLQK